MSSNKNTNSLQKRYDIQWLRAFSVIFVILFHLWPKAFPNGYLGVDIFFVISGFLMTSILSKSIIDYSMVKLFYFQRIKRIFPTCLLVIFLTIIAGKFLLLSSHYKNLLMDGLWAIAFSTNIEPIIYKTNYFDMVSEYKFLLHTWSLGVEIQFYFIAPLIFFIIFNYGKKQIIPTLIIALASFSFQIFYPSETIRFNFIFSRIWQFLFGSIAFFYSSEKPYIPIPQNSNENESEILFLNENEAVADVENGLFIFIKKINWQFFTLILINFFIFLPFPWLINIHQHNIINVVGIRFIITILASFFIAFPSQSSLLILFTFSTMVERINLIFIYIGDASYVIYLIHWPIIIFARYYYFFSITFSVILFFIIFISGFVIHDLYEKPLRKFENFGNICIIIFFYFIIAFLSIYYFHKNGQISGHNLNTDTKMTIAEIITENENLASLNIQEFPCAPDSLIEEFSIKLWANISGYRCSHTFKNITTINNNNNLFKKEAVILGNSYAGAQFPGIANALKQLNYTKVYLFVRAGCLPHGGDLNYEYPTSQCPLWIGNVFDKFLFAVKPEVIFLTARLTMFEGLMKPLPPKSSSRLLSNDFAVQQLNASILNFAKFTKEIVIISPNPEIDFPRMKISLEFLTKLKSMINFTYTSPLSIAQRLQQGQNITDLVLPLKYVYEITHAPEIRLIAAMNQCLNCLFLNTTKIFCNENGCPLFDERNLGILKDTSHLTRIGASKLTKPIIELLLKKSVVNKKRRRHSNPTTTVAAQIFQLHNFASLAAI